MKNTNSVFDVGPAWTRQHIANIERESEVLKNVVRDICTTLAMQARDLGHAPLAVKYLELREELESIFPKRKSR